MKHADFNLDDRVATARADFLLKKARASPKRAYNNPFEMTTDDIQRLASNVRLAGIVVTFVGFIITCWSHAIAEKLLASQRTDKTKAQERLNATESELKATKAKTAELTNRLANRTFRPEQRTAFIKYLESAPKGPVVIGCVAPDNETSEYIRQIRGLLDDAGYAMPAEDGVRIWYGQMSLTTAGGQTLSVIVHRLNDAPSYAGHIQNAFKSIGIDAAATEAGETTTVGKPQDFVRPGEVMVFITERR